MNAVVCGLEDAVNVVYDNRSRRYLVIHTNQSIFIIIYE